MGDRLKNVAQSILQRRQRNQDGFTHITNFSPTSVPVGFLSPRRKTRPSDQLDSWLDEQGFYRKHTAKDESCLFRAVAEQILFTQVRHPVVRRSVVDYILKNGKKFQQLIDEPIDVYAEKIRSSRAFGGKIEIIAMSLLYKCDFKMYREIGQPAENYTNHGFQKQIVLCNSPDNHFDSVYTNERICDEGFCQSIVYGILYKEVFNMEEVDYARDKMLTGKPNKQRNIASPCVAAPERYELREQHSNAKKLLEMGITPFPYKVAKALNPDLYRNVEFDTWKEYKKGLRYGFLPWTCPDLEVGVKCLVTIDENTSHTGHIQSMSPNQGPVEVFVENLGKKITVPYNSLKMLPPSSLAPPTPRTWPNQKQPVTIGRRKNHSPLEVSMSRKPSYLNCGQRIVTSKESPQTEGTQSSLISSQTNATQNRPTNRPESQHGLTAEQASRALDGCPCDGNPEGSTYFSHSHVTPPTQSVYVPPEGAYEFVILNRAPSVVASQSPENRLVVQVPKVPPPPVNSLVRKSVLHDGSDLPFHDIGTLQYCFNLGVESMRYYYSQWGTLNAWNAAPALALQPGSSENGSYLAIENQSHYVEEAMLNAETDGNSAQRMVNHSYVTYGTVDSTQQGEDSGNSSPGAQNGSNRGGNPGYGNALGYGSDLIQVPEVSSTVTASPAEQDGSQPSSYLYQPVDSDQPAQHVQVEANPHPVQYMYNVPQYAAVYTYTVPCVTPDGTIYFQTCFAPQPPSPSPQNPSL